MRISFYHFEKWFFDILTEDREYTIIFLSLLQILGLKLCYLTIDHGSYQNKIPEFKSYSRRLKLIKRNRDTFVTDLGVITIGNAKSSFILTGPELSIKATIHARNGASSNLPGLLIRKNKRQYLNWKPRVLQNHSKCNIFLNNMNLLAEGNGYLDYLSSTFQPFAIPVNSLFWGRIHGDGMNLTYSYAEGKYGAYWSALVYQSGEQCKQLKILHVEPADFRYLEETGISCPTSYRVLAESPGLSISLEVRHLKPAIVSSFSDIPKTSKRIGSSLIKKLLRNPRGGKFFSVARVEIKEKAGSKVFDQLIMIDEYIVFSGDES